MPNNKTMIHYHGETHSVEEWAVILDMSVHTIHKRVSQGYCASECLRKERKKRRPDIENRQPRSHTLCWDCGNSCGGCAWSREFKPVDGWEAEPTKVKVADTNQYVRLIDSFIVRSCPEFIRDSKGGGQTRYEEAEDT